MYLKKGAFRLNFELEIAEDRPFSQPIKKAIGI